MNSTELRQLDAAVQYLSRQPAFQKAVQLLKAELTGSTEPFVWSTIALDSIPSELPTIIRSCWIFHLRRDVMSGCHYHPNSIQHMVAVDGWGTAIVGGKRRRIVPFASQEHLVAEKWHIIPQNVGHEFLPEHEDMTVVSFHTCAETELEEVDCESGAVRVYEKAR